MLWDKAPKPISHLTPPEVVACNNCPKRCDATILYSLFIISAFNLNLVKVGFRRKRWINPPIMRVSKPASGKSPPENVNEGTPRPDLSLCFYKENREVTE